MSNANAQSRPQRATVNDPPQRPRRGPTFFFGLAVAYLLLLLLVAVGREAGFWFLDDLHDPIAGVLPLGVPWFGALGAVTLSFYGVFDHNDHWDYKWNYWYVARPLVGIVLAIIAYFIFITLISSTGLTPRTSGTTSTTTSTTLETTTTAEPTTAEPTTAQPSGTTTGNSGNTGSIYQPQPAGQPAAGQASPTSAPGETGGAAPAPSSLLPYYVLAFLVGFREDTFRTLIKRAADVLLGPGDPGVPSAGITVHPAPIQFFKVAVGGTSVETVTVSNSGTGDLQIYPSRASAPGTELSDENGVFRLFANSVEGAKIAPGANATLKVEFAPTATVTYIGTLTIASNAGTNLIDIFGEGFAPDKPKETKPARRGPLTRLRRRGGRNR
jgi:hypothetical protein